MLSTRKSRLISALALVALALPAIIGMTRMSANLDMLWLCEGMSRLLAGGRMSEVAYDTNPPLSFLIYLLPVLLHSVTGLSVVVAATLQTILLLAWGTLITWRMLGCFKGVSEAGRCAVVGGYLLGNIVLSGYYFGERDHLAGIVLIPFILWQLALTYHLSPRPGRAFPLIAGLLLLLKPHLLIVPAALWCYRLAQWRQRQAFLAPDGGAVAAMAILYAIVTAIFFRDYIEVILPDVLSYYGSPASLPFLLMQLSMMKFPLLLGLMLVPGLLLVLDPDVRRVSCAFMLAAILSVMAALLQNKGFYYHWLPALLCLSVALPVLLEHLAGRLMKGAAGASLFLSLAVTGGLMYASMLPGGQAQGQATFNPDSALVKEIVARTKPGESFLLSAFGMQQIHEIAYYTGRTHASRFPVFWFMPGLGGQPAGPDVARFGDMVAADLDLYQPKIVVLLQSLHGSGGLPQVFGGQPAFDAAWAAYSPAGQVTDQVTIPGQNIKYNRIFDVYLRTE